MKIIFYFQVLVVVLFAGFTTFADQSTGLLALSDHPDDKGKVSVVKQPSTHYLYKQVSGGYHQHAAILGSMTDDLKELELADKQVIGIYPDDPETTPESDLKWQIGLRLENAIKPMKDYKYQLIPELQCARIETTLANSQEAGLALFEWIVEHRYVQTGPTQMIYYEIDKFGQEDIPVVILTPVKKREKTINQ